MEKITHKEERRRYPRFKVQGMVVTAACQPSPPLGSIKKMSQSGLIFHYCEDKNSRVDYREIDIIWADYVSMHPLEKKPGKLMSNVSYVATHHLKKIPVQVVSDLLIENGREDDESATRRQAVAFGNMTLFQETQIYRLINNAQGTIPIHQGMKRLENFRQSEELQLNYRSGPVAFIRNFFMQIIQDEAKWLDNQEDPIFKKTPFY